MNVYERITILDGKRVKNKVLCRCQCGTEKWINIFNIIRGDVKSCGCLKKDKMKIEASKRFLRKTPANFTNFEGRKIGLITVIKRIENLKEETNYLVKCDCGTEFEVRFSNLRRGNYNTCKCGYPKHSLKQTLQSMIDRCDNAKHQDYKWYGGKGITVCDIWKKFPIKFIEWSLENGWAKGLSIDRIDSSLGYSPENCRWISMQENSKKAAEERWAQKISE
jgi:hypothetical protein